MVSNFQFLIKALRFPATAPTLLALSLTAFLAGQFNSLLSSQTLQPASEDDDLDQSPEGSPLSQDLSPLETVILPEQLLPELLPQAQAQFSPSLAPPAIIPDALKPIVNRSSPSANLDLALPKPLAAPPPLRPVRTPLRPIQVGPDLVQSAVSRTLAYQTVSSAAPQPVSTHWVDVEQHWSQPYVNALASMGIIQGLPNGDFEPDRPITRAELADLLQRSLPRPEIQADVVALRDVPPSHWAATSINRAVRMGFFPDAAGTLSFNPDRPASRLVTWGAIVSGLDLPSSKQHNALLQAWEASQVNNPEATSAQLSPQDELSQPVTRAETIALLYHALRLTEQGKHLAFIPPAQTVPAERPSLSPPSPLAQRNPASVQHASGTASEARSLAEARSTVARQEPLEPAVVRSVASEHSSPSSTVALPERPVESRPPQPQAPVLVAAQLPLPDPLLAPLPPVSAEPILESQEHFQPVERLSPEFAAEPSSSQLPPEVSGERNLLDSAFPNPAAVDQTYRLGAGDRVFIEVFGLPQYSQEYQVLVDGSLNLPRAGRMVVEGMTLAEAESLIYGRYARYYQQPATSVVLMSPRSLRIAVTGAVNRPGVYRLSPNEGAAVPSVTQALQEAGGINPDADLRQVKVYRSQGNGNPQELALNLWNLLQNGDLDQDISLRDGDRVVIPQAESLSIEDLNQIATANIAPNAIEVTVVGSAADSQGALKLSPNTPLNQVILAAGGFNDRRQSRTVNLIRLHPNGSVEQRLLEVPIAADVNETNNPILRDKDVIVLDRSKGSVVRESTLGVLGNILRVIPFVNLLF
ncbi:MAG: polysaccharide biosynthesis/export family protein [Prochlorotrichaceae cyanobacterium]|jgi:polysaccharide export outer membrane protein